MILRNFNKEIFNHVLYSSKDLRNRKKHNWQKINNLGKFYPKTQKIKTILLLRNQKKKNFNRK